MRLFADCYCLCYMSQCVLSNACSIFSVLLTFFDITVFYLDCSLCSIWLVVLLLVFYNVCVFLFFFFFKQKTAYEMRISDWSSDRVLFRSVRAPQPRAGRRRSGAVPLLRPADRPRRPPLPPDELVPCPR